MNNHFGFSPHAMLGDWASNEVGFWKKSVIINSKPKSVVIVREVDGSFTIADTGEGSVEVLGHTDTVDAAAQMANNYMAHDLYVAKFIGGRETTRSK